MWKIYVQRIIDGRMTIDEVPEKHLAKVMQALEEL